MSKIRAMMSMRGLVQNTKYPYVFSLIGVALIGVITVYGAVRGMMRQSFRSGFNGTFTGATFSGARQFGGGAGLFGLTGTLTAIGVVIAVLGLAWLGFALRSSKKSA